MRFLFGLLLLALVMLGGCADRPMLAANRALADLARLEREWLDAYDTGDREAMARILADGFTITFANGRVQTKAEVLDGLEPGRTPTGPTHYTEDRTIRVVGSTAILSGIYVNPGDEGEPDGRARYTDTWMFLDGRWQVVASHLSSAAPPPR